MALLRDTSYQLVGNHEEEEEDSPSSLSIGLVVHEDEDEKCCRICLENDGQMIAPCHCKGTSKWVHRECLDLWRSNEKDRAFSQCTECQFKYQFMPPSDKDARAWRKAKFCLFVSRDFCLVMTALQLVIGLIGFLILKSDDENDFFLLSLLNGYNCNHYHGKQDDSSDITYNVDGNLTWWCRHKGAAYYLFGVIGLLVLLGLFGSTMLCCNGCKIPNLEQDKIVTQQNETTDPPAQTRDVNGPSLNRSNKAQPHESNDYIQQRTAYYRNQRRRHLHRTNHCCYDCCDCCLTCSPPYGHSHCYCYSSSSSRHSPGCCCMGDWDDCGECCHSASSGGSTGGGDRDAAHIMLVLLLVAVIIMAIIGLFVGLFLTVMIAQKIVQRHLFRLHKRELVQEFQVVDLSSAGCGPSLIVVEGPTAEELRDEERGCPGVELTSSLKPSPLPPADEQHLRKLGLLE